MTSKKQDTNEPAIFRSPLFHCYMLFGVAFMLGEGLDHNWITTLFLTVAFISIYLIGRLLYWLITGP